MHTITEQSELSEYLFQVLAESEPYQEVNASFLLRISGICYSIIHGGLHYEPPYLSDIIAFHWERRTSLLCGKKLVALAQALAAEGCFEPDRVWSTRRLIELMTAALDSNDLRMERDQETEVFYIISSQAFSTEHGMVVRVKLEPEPEVPADLETASQDGIAQ